MGSVTPGPIVVSAVEPEPVFIGAPLYRYGAAGPMRPYWPTRGLDSVATKKVGRQNVANYLLGGGTGVIGSDLAARRIVLGGRFGEEDSAVSFARLDRFAEAGGQLVDTAHCYAGGESERVIGRWLAAHPDAVAVVEKIGHPESAGLPDLSPARLRREVVSSLRRLGLPAVDVLLLHRDDPRRPVADLIGSLRGLLTGGYARRVGVSNWSAPRLAEAVAVAVRAGLDLVVSYQYGLAVPEGPLWPGARHADPAILEIIRRYRLPLLAWAGQARGFFTGRTEPLGYPPRDPFDLPVNRARRRRCRALASRIGAAPETVALAWSLHAPGVLPVVGPRSVDELETSLAATRVALDAEARCWLWSGRGQLR